MNYTTFHVENQEKCETLIEPEAVIVHCIVRRRSERGWKSVRLQHFCNPYREITKSGARGGAAKIPTYVVSHKKDLKLGKNTYLYSGDLTELAQKVKAETDKDIWLFGGGDLTTQFINLHLVDELAIAIVPVLIGGDVPFFGNVVEQKDLLLLGSKTYEKSGMVSLTYGFKKPGEVVKIKNDERRTSQRCGVFQTILPGIPRRPLNHYSAFFHQM